MAEDKAFEEYLRGSGWEGDMTGTSEEKKA